MESLISGLRRGAGVARRSGHASGPLAYRNGTCGFPQRIRINDRKGWTLHDMFAISMFALDRMDRSGRQWGFGNVPISVAFVEEEETRVLATRNSLPPRGRGPCIGHSHPLVAFLTIEGRHIVSCKTCMVGGFHGGRRSFDCSASPAVFRQAPCSPHRLTGLVWAFHGPASLQIIMPVG
jgi:hypothetical protein